MTKTLPPSVAERSREGEVYGRLRAAMPPADLRSADVGEFEQIELTLALLRRAHDLRARRSVS